MAAEYDIPDVNFFAKNGAPGRDQQAQAAPSSTRLPAQDQATRLGIMARFIAATLQMLQHEPPVNFAAIRR